MSEPRIFSSKDKHGKYTILMTENGAPPEKMAKFRDEDVLSSYTALFDWLYEKGEELTNYGRSPTLSPEESSELGNEMFSWCDRMAGSVHKASYGREGESDG